MDIYAEITNRIINQLEQGVIPWRKPWVACGAAISYATGKPYSLLNQMLLGKAGEYLTFKQVQSAGGRVRKGEKSHMVVFWKFLTVEDEDTKEESSPASLLQRVPYRPMRRNYRETYSALGTQR